MIHLHFRHQLRQEAEFLALQAPRQELHTRKAGDMQRTLLFSAGPAHDLHDLGFILIADDIGAGLDDPALVPGDLRQRRAQIFCVLQSDPGDDGRLRRIDHIGRIKGSSQADLQDDEITLLLREPDHADRRDQLELGRMVLHGLRQVPDTRSDAGQGVLRYIFPAHLDPLPKILDIGVGVEAGPAPRLPQDPLDHGTGGALAVAARHMDKAQALLRITQEPEQVLCPREPQLPLAPGVGIDIFDRFLYCHPGLSSALFQISLRSAPAERAGGRRRL